MEEEEEEEEIENVDSITNHCIEFDEDGGLSYSFPFAKKELFFSDNNMSTSKVNNENAIGIVLFTENFDLEIEIENIGPNSKNELNEEKTVKEKESEMQIENNLPRDKNYTLEGLIEKVKNMHFISSYYILEGLQQVYRHSSLNKVIHLQSYYLSFYRMTLINFN